MSNAYRILNILDFVSKYVVPHVVLTPPAKILSKLSTSSLREKTKKKVF